MSVQGQKSGARREGAVSLQGLQGGLGPETKDLLG